MKKILVVGEDVIEIQFVKQILRPRYEVFGLPSADMLMDRLKNETADLILMDYNLPGRNGLEVLRDLQGIDAVKDIPVIMMVERFNSAMDAPCLVAGAKDILVKPLVPVMVKNRVEHILELGDLKARMRQNLEENSRQVESVVFQAISTMANTVDAKDDYTGEHSIRVAQYAALIAKELGWVEEDVRNIHHLGLLHDIGKISVPDVIIQKPSSLNDIEWHTMKSHTTIGAEILKDIHMVKKASEVALYHHEWYNGTGYPTGAAREQIPIEARIVCIADSYDAMTSNRVYRKALDMERVKREFIKGRGTQFDPTLVEVVLAMIDEGKLEQPESVDFAPTLTEQNTAAEESNLLLYRFMEMNNRESRMEAMRDGLTGLFNRRYAERQVEEFLDQRKSGFFCIIDLDNFKDVNEHYGHIEGDGALKCVADILLDCIGDMGFACRIGGDEFCVFTDGFAEKEEMDNFCIQVINAYNRVVVTTDTLMGTSLSIGISKAFEDGDSYSELYAAADKALYYAKRNGKNRYSYYGTEAEPFSGGREVVIDIRQLDMLIRDTKKTMGSYHVGYVEFQRIFNFITRCVERTNQEVQLMLVSLKGRGSDKELEVEMEKLCQAVSRSLRRNDVSTKYEDSQLLVVLVDITTEHVQIIQQRVWDNYFAASPDSKYELQFEQMQVKGKKV